MPDQTLNGFQVHLHDCFCLQGYRAGKTHVIGRLANHQDGRDKNVTFLRDQFAALDTLNEISANGQVIAVLFQRADGNDDEVRAGLQRSDFRRRHMRQVILNFLLRPERIGLSYRLTKKKNRKDQENSIKNSTQIEIQVNIEKLEIAINSLLENAPKILKDTWS